MHRLLSAIILLAAILNMVLGIGFLVNPVSSANEFGLEATGAHGSSTLRADMTAFFFVAAFFLVWGAWKRRGDVLLAPLILYTVAFTGRLVNLFVVGPYDAWALPISIEMGHVVVIALAIRAWGGWPKRA